jgi:phage-related protein
VRENFAAEGGDMPNYQPFIGFTYNGEHSIEDLHIYRTSNGNRYDDNLTATMTDKTVDVPGGDGQYYFGTTFKNRTFTVPFAFDNLKQSDIAKMKRVFSGDGIHELVFDEDRDNNGKALKIWSAKVTGTATMKHLCFDEVDEKGSSIEVYKGEGSITFTCYYPYARSEKILIADGSKVNNKKYEPINNGDMPASFVIDFSYTNDSGMKLPVYGILLYLGNNASSIKRIKFLNSIMLKPNESIRYIWDAKLGLLYQIENNTKIIVPTTTDALMTLPVGSPIGHYFHSPIALLATPDGNQSPIYASIHQDTGDATEFRELYR